MRRARGFLLMALVTLCACHRSDGTANVSKPAPAPRLTIVTDRLSLENLEKLSLDEARRVRPDVFRLRPDRRFLIALGEAQLLMARPASARLHVAWKDGAWVIDSGGSIIGSVPEIASYEQLRAVLTTWTGRLVSASGAAAPAKAADLAEIRAECDRFEPSAAIRALKKIDVLWPSSGKPDPELAALAGRAFVVLCLQGLDTLDMADLLRARALALLALAGALGAAADPSNEAILASCAGYGPDGIRIARALPEDDPVRLYVEGRTSALVEAARKNDANRRTRYLALLSLGSRRDEVAWSKFLDASFGDEGFSLPVLRAASNLGSFGVNSGLGTATIYAALMDLEGPPKSPTVTLDPELAERFAFAQEVVEKFVGVVRRSQKLESAGLVRQFEASLAKASSQARGPLWDAHAARAWHRGAFYSGLQLVGWYYLDQQGTVEGTREFAQYLQGSPEGPASQFAQWYGDVSAMLLGGRVTDRHFDDLITLTDLGSLSVRRLAPELRSTYYKRRDASGLIAARVAGRLDARPANVAFMQTIAAYPLQDLRMVERLCRDWLAQGWSGDLDEGSMTGHCLWFAGDLAGLTSFLANRDIPVLARGEMLFRYAVSADADDKVCRSAYESLAVESGYAETIVQGWSYYLQHKKPPDYAGALRAVDAWLAHHGPSGFTGSVFLGRRARLVSMLGRPEEAWHMIGPAVAAGQNSVMVWGADILVKLGRLDDAYALARQIVERYPQGAEGRSALAEILWRQKRYSEAAFVLDPPERGYKVDEGGFRDELAPRFGAVFAKAPDEAVIAAFAALESQGVDARYGAYLVTPLAEAGRNELAFRVQSTRFLKGNNWALGDQVLRGYQYLEKAKGRPEAIAWVPGVIPPQQLQTTLEAFFNKKAWNLVWDAVPVAGEAGLSEWAWLLRAGAATADENVARARRPALLEHYRDAKPGDADRAIGRYLIGLDRREAVLAAAIAPVDRCKAAYFFGLQDVVAGRYEDGSDWYQLVYDTCGNDWAWRLVSFTWSTMNEWYYFDRNLRAAAAHRVW